MRKRDEPAGRGVYICLRAYDKTTHKTMHLKGRGLRVYDWTPAEVQQILIRAFHEEQQRVLAAKERK